MLIYTSAVTLIYSLFLTFIIGICAGSFLNCAAMRISRGESFIKGRSRCISCGHELGILDLFPLFSWLLLGGKCRYCGKKISARYPVTELCFGIISVITVLTCDISFIALRNWLFFCILFLLSLVDLEIYEIPDGCHIASIIIWVCFMPFYESLKQEALSGLIAAVVFGGVLLGISLLMDRLLEKESMGGGDIKLTAVCALYLGLLRSLFSVILACVIGLVMGTVLKKDSERHFAFGPSIALSTFIMLLWGNTFTDWYLGLF